MFRKTAQLLRTSLTAKISFLTGSMLVLAVLVFAGAFVFSARLILAQDAARTARLFALYSTPQAYDLYVQFYSHPAPADFMQFQNKMNDILRSNSDVVSIQLVAINGKVLFDSNEARSRRYEGPDRFVTDEDVLRLVRSGVLDVHEHAVQSDGSSLQVIVPVNAVEGAHVLSTVYNFSYASLLSRLTYIQYVVAAIALLLVLIGIIVPIMFISRTIRPLTTLRQAAERVGEGDYSAQVSVVSQDEVGTLARAFMQMISRVKKSQSDLQTKVSELENLNKVMVGRELRMIQLKEELAKLKGTEENV